MVCHDCGPGRIVATVDLADADPRPYRRAGRSALALVRLRMHGGRMPGVVLVVEDDRELRELLRRYLERAGRAVHTTGSGAEAIGLLAAGGVELVVLDLGLPDVAVVR